MGCALRWISTISRRLHDVSFRDTSESLCSRAWRLQDRSTFWLTWTYIFGRSHCRNSWEHYHANTETK